MTNKPRDSYSIRDVMYTPNTYCEEGAQTGKVSPFEMEFEKIAGNINYINELTAELELRVNHVLSPPEPQCDSKDVCIGRALMSPICERLDEQNARLERSIRRITDILHRLEI